MAEKKSTQDKQEHEDEQYLSDSEKIQEGSLYNKIVSKILNAIKHSSKSQDSKKENQKLASNATIENLDPIDPTSIVKFYQKYDGNMDVLMKDFKKFDNLKMRKMELKIAMTIVKIEKHFDDQNMLLWFQALEMKYLEIRRKKERESHKRQEQKQRDKEKQKQKNQMSVNSKTNPQKIPLNKQSLLSAKSHASSQHQALQSQVKQKNSQECHDFKINSSSSEILPQKSLSGFWEYFTSCTKSISLTNKKMALSELDEEKKSLKND